MKKEGIKLYNVIFPIWMIPYIAFFMPMYAWQVILIVLLGNFIIDSLVYLINMKVLKIENIKENYKKGVWKIYLFGFLADIIGGIFMIIPEFFSANRWIYDNLTSKIMWNPYESIYSIIWMLIGFLITVLLIYIFNYKCSFKKLEIDLKKKKQMAITLAIATAPYLFLLPTVWFYKGY